MQNILNRISIYGTAIIREPLFQFILIGAAIFAVSEITADWKENRLRIISVDDGLENYLENLYSAQFGVNPDKESLDRLVENYIREEVMYREALRLGLAEQDEIIRRRLVQKMEFLLTDTGTVADPDTTVIKAYYKNHASDYTLPARVSFRHLYFGSDSSKALKARQRAAHALQKIQSGQLQEAATGADQFPLNDHYVELDQHDARQLFGQTEFVRSLFKMSTGEWSGPFESGYGWHLILVEKRNEARLQPYEQVKDSVITAWRNENSARQFESVMQDLISQYEIRRNAGSNNG